MKLILVPKQARTQIFEREWAKSFFGVTICNFPLVSSKTFGWGGVVGGIMQCCTFSFYKLKCTLPAASVK